MNSFLLAALLSVNTAEVGVACHALNTGRFVQVNPMSPGSCVGIASLKVATTGAPVYMIQRYVPKRHQKWAYLTMLGASAVVVSVNMRTIQHNGGR